ncbi:hypothetical protein B0T10DRAFT_483381 [Thelonectria olida]|uniref:Uncharacterized protein n=1 Tax=Thelonectria olida TaxID=1576542 RepID=A0A9P8W731_9HYPO|nr:hypothetical protein B0T10DRAFT_483381 [Thelonectria olida]
MSIDRVFFQGVEFPHYHDPSFASHLQAGNDAQAHARTTRLSSTHPPAPYAAVSNLQLAFTPDENNPDSHTTDGTTPPGSFPSLWTTIEIAVIGPLKAALSLVKTLEPCCFRFLGSRCAPVGSSRPGKEVQERAWHIRSLDANAYAHAHARHTRGKTPHPARNPREKEAGLSNQCRSPSFHQPRAPCRGCRKARAHTDKRPLHTPSPFPSAV